MSSAAEAVGPQGYKAVSSAAEAVGPQGHKAVLLAAEAVGSQGKAGVSPDEWDYRDDQPCLICLHLISLVGQSPLYRDRVEDPGDLHLGSGLKRLANSIRTIGTLTISLKRCHVLGLRGLSTGSPIWTVKLSLALLGSWKVLVWAKSPGMNEQASETFSLGAARHKALSSPRRR